MGRLSAWSLWAAVILAMGAFGMTSGCKGKSGAGGGEKKGRVGACNRIKTDSVCFQFGEPNFAAAGEKYLREYCGILKGEFSLGPCPAKGRVGTCATPEGTRVYYRVGGYPLTAAKAKRDWCKSGTWKAAPSSRQGS